MTTTKKASAKRPAKKPDGGTATSRMSRGGRVPEKKERIVAMLRRGATAADITKTVGCTQAMTYKVIAEYRDSIRVVGVEGTSRVMKLVDKEPFPFAVGEYVRVIGRRVNPIGEDVILLGGGVDGTTEYELVVP